MIVIEQYSNDAENYIEYASRYPIITIKNLITSAKDISKIFLLYTSEDEYREILNIENKFN